MLHPAARIQRCCYISDACDIRFGSFGFWLGPTALKTIERYAPNQPMMLAVLASVVAATVVTHALARRARTPLPMRRQITEVEA